MEMMQDLRQSFMQTTFQHSGNGWHKAYVHMPHVDVSYVITLKLQYAAIFGK